MLESNELDQVQRIFGSSELQVRRDHAISHVLAAIQHARAEFVFFGGTALSRTYLTSGRLSEDIDLFSSDSNREFLSRELDHLPEMIEQEFPGANWEALPSRVSDPRSALLNCDPSIKIKVQVLDAVSRGWQKIPVKISQIHQRYSDVPQTKMHTPTFDGFVAMKALAWFDRRAARDLFDLGALSRVGAVTDVARDLIVDLLGYQLSTSMMDRGVSGDWQVELAHQTRLERTEEQCLAQVLDWWSAPSGSPNLP
jgi:predicted nucleotidyltransferase component of viral defense system